MNRIQPKNEDVRSKLLHWFSIKYEMDLVSSDHACDTPQVSQLASWPLQPLISDIVILFSWDKVSMHLLCWTLKRQGCGTGKLQHSAAFCLSSPTTWHSKSELHQQICNPVHDPQKEGNPMNADLGLCSSLLSHWLWCTAAFHHHLVASGWGLGVWATCFEGQSPSVWKHGRQWAAATVALKSEVFCVQACRW